MAINYTSDIISAMYASKVAVSAAYQSPGTYNIPALYASGGPVLGVTVVSPGTGFTSRPTPVITGDGSGATATCTLTQNIPTAVAARGTAYVVGNILTLTGGTQTTPATYVVATLELATLAINAAGSGYNVGDVVTLAGGTFSTPATITVSTLTGGPGTGISTFAITTRGNYTVPSAALTQASASPATGTGATFQTGVFGVRSVTIGTPGVYTVLPGNPVSVTGGGGAGATFTVDWGVGAFTITAAGTLYNRAAITFSPSGGGTPGSYTVTFNPSTTEQELLTMVELVRAYFANVASAQEAKLAQQVIGRMVAALQQGAGTTYTAANNASRAQAAALRFFAKHQRNTSL